MSACTVREWPVHPAAELFPMLGADELRELADDIKANGQVEPILIYEGQLLDGRNRLAACKLVGVTPKTRVVEKCDSPTQFVISLNLKRRHLNAAQKGVVAVEALPLFEEEAKARQVAAGGDRRSEAVRPIGGGQSVPNRSDRDRDESARATHQAAAATGAGIQATKTLAAVAKKAPEVFAAVKSGKVDSIADARRLAELAPEKRETVMAKLEGPEKPKSIVSEINALKFAEAKAKAAAEAASAKIVPVVDLANATDWLGKLAPQSADLLLTDPPYMTDVADIHGFARSWAPLALSRVKPTGRAYICIGAYGEELHAYLDVLRAQTDFTLANILVWTYRNTIGPSPRLDYKQNWQAILYLRGPEAPALDCHVMLEQFTVQDINAPDGRLGDRFHAWQKPDALAERLVRHSTKPGALVIDPFVCTGTFVLTAARLGRNARGCDISAENLKIAEQRGCRRGV